MATDLNPTVGALRRLVEEVNGFVYAGDRLDAIVKAVEVIASDASLAHELFPELFKAEYEYGYNEGNNDGHQEAIWSGERE